LLQIVVLIAFFNVFSRVLKSDANIINNFNQLLYPPLQFAADAIVNTKFLIWDITKPDTITGILPIAIPGPLLILAAITQFVSAKITQPYLEAEEAIAKKTKNEKDDMQVAMQQSMVYTFPLITLLVGISFASGLVLYWLVFSVTQAYQQYSTSGWGGMTPWIKKAGLLK